MSKNIITIGRDPRCDIRVDARWDTVSNEHADIELRDGALLFYDHSSNALTGSLVVTLPISSMLPGSSSSIAIKDAEDAVRVSSLSLQNAKDTLLETIRECVMQIEQAQESVGMQRSSYAAAQRSYELSQEAFDAGLITADDLASARNDMLSAELSLLSTELNHLLSCYSLSFALGMDIDELTASYATSEENIQ